jgi:general secretion pathway protein J
MKPQRGFTLLEMLLALALFALLSLAGYQLLQGSVRVQQQSQQHTQQLSELSRLFALLEQDLKHALILPSAVLLKQAAFRAQDQDILLQFTRRNWLNPLHEPRSALQQVRWQFTQHTLSRQRISDGVEIHFPHIQKITLRFFSAGRWQDRWTSQFSLPQAIEITLTTARWGAIQRVLLVGNAQ